MTAKVNAYFKPKMTPRQRYDAFDKASKDLVAAGEKAGKDLRCTLASMYSGNAYYLYTFKQIRDVRLVYAPPQDLGNYGGETDNWMWPRHTCDFSFLRAYVAPDGTAADFSPSNVPYKPKVWLKVSLDGFKEGDFTFVMGYPGRTYRNYALSELKVRSGEHGPADQRHAGPHRLLRGRREERQGSRDPLRQPGQGALQRAEEQAGQARGLPQVRPRLQKGRPGEGTPRLDRRRPRPGQEIRRGPGRPRGVPGPAEGVRRQDGAPERRPRRFDHPVPGLQHRPGRARDPEARQGPGTGLPGAQPAPPQAGHPAGREGLCLRHGPGAAEVDAQAPQGLPSGRGRVARLAQGPGRRERSGCRRPRRRHVRQDGARRSGQKARDARPQAGRARGGRRSLPQARGGHGAGAQGRPRGEQRAWARKAPTSSGPTKRPSWT
ncbi:MAG: S46 family peptidase [Candidatus Moduliflexus flocculans]|nr:S46 family peptidase [Candidatus Moduliflexus flocculans]